MSEENTLTQYTGSEPLAPTAPPGLATSLADEDDGGSLSLRRYLDAARRYRWAILAVVVVGTGIGVVVAELAPQQYSAQATVWIEGGGGGAGPIQSGELLSQTTAWLDLLKSYVVLDHVVRERKLYLQPRSHADSLKFASFALKDRFRPGRYELSISSDRNRFVLSSRVGGLLQEGVLGDSIGPEQGFAWQPARRLFQAGERVEFELLVPREVSLELGKELNASVDPKRGNFMRLTLRQPTAAGAAGVLNAVVDRFMEVATDLKRSKLEELTLILNEQLAYADQNLRTSEMALEGFRIQTITLPSDESAVPVPAGLASTIPGAYSQHFALKVQADQIRQDREALAATLRRGVTPEALEIIPAVGTSSSLRGAISELTGKKAELRGWLHRYTEAHPPVVQLQQEIDNLEQRILPALIGDLDTELGERFNQIQSEIGSSGDELQQIPPRMIEEARLRRQVAIAENLYTTLQKRYEESRLGAASSLADISVLDRAAVPQRPVKDTKPRIIVMAFLGSLGVGLLGAVLRDRFDSRLRYPEEVTAGLGLPIIGGLPAIPQNGKAHHGESFEQVIEAFRTIRLSLIHAYGKAGPLIITVSSPGSGDGKSFVSSNLAVAFAELGYKTALVDADVRRGRLHHLFQQTHRRPGLTEYLQGSLELDGLIQSTQYPLLSLITCGARQHNAPELLGMRRMRDLLQHVRSRHQVVIVDSSPLGAGADAFMLSTLTGHLLLVLRAGSTDRQLAEANLGLLQRLPVRLVGAVLNAVPRTGSYRYYGYLSGYETSDEESASSPAVIQAT
ncbi:MAG: GumC family protein [Longimicrobiales bacterium]